MLHKNSWNGFTLTHPTGWEVLALHRQAAAARLPQEKEMLQRQIQATDGQIDHLVYELYGLTVGEIKIVEEGS